MAWDGSGTQWFRTTNEFTGGSANSAWSAHCFVRSSAAPAGNWGPAINIRNNQASKTPDAGLNWDHSASGFRQAAYNRAGFSSGAYTAAKGTTSLSADTWYSFGGSYDGTNVRFYLNGTLEATSAASPSTNGTSFDISLFSILLNDTTLDGSGTTQFALGRLAECAVWLGETLTADNFVALSKGFRPHIVRPRNLSFYMPLVRGTQNLKDTSIYSSGSGAVQPHPRVF